MDSNSNEKTKELISFGADIVGSAASGALGFLAAGPVGAAAGAVAGPLVTRGLKATATEFASRVLSRREKVKVGAGLTFAYNKIVQYLEEGRTPRDDGFFDRDASGRSESDEILEGVLFKCKNEHEEKKLKFLGNIYANVAFMPEVSAVQANWLLRKAEELTYRQLCMIAIIEQYDDPYSRGPSYGPGDGDPAFEMEYKELKDILTYDDEDIEAYYRGHYDSVGEPSPVTGLTRVGKFYYTVMGLAEIPEDDLRGLAPRFARAFKE